MPEAIGRVRNKREIKATTEMPDDSNNEVDSNHIELEGYPESYTESEKQLHSQQWSKSNIEELLKSWGEKAGGLRWMHVHSATFWRQRDNRLNYIGITLSSVISASSLTGPTEAFVGTDYIMLFVGITGMVNMLVQSLQRFYRSSERASQHETAARQFGNFNRYVATKLSLSRTERGPPKQILTYALNENDRLHKETLDPHPSSIKAFREHFADRANDHEFAIPDFVTDTFKMATYDEEEGGEVCVTRPIVTVSSKRKLSSTFNVLTSSLFKTQTDSAQ